MEIGGEGALCVAVLWSLTFLVLLFLALRIYTRVVCVAAYGVDDHFYLVAAILTIAYSSMVTVAAKHGYGRDDLTPAENARATYFRMVAQTFSLLATGTSKASVGFFLNRIVIVPWQKYSILVIVTVMIILSIVNTFFTWLACDPLPFAYDVRINGYCFDTTPSAVMLAMGTIAVDLYFAILPWIFIRKLNLPRRERLVIAGSLSLGLVAAAAGAIRVMNVRGVREVPVAVIIWSQVETSMTLICVGIPVCRPLFSKLFAKWKQSRPGKPQESMPPPSSDQQPVGLHTIGGTPMHRGPTEGSKRSKWSEKFNLTGLTKTSTAGEEDEIDLTRADDRLGNSSDKDVETKKPNAKDSWIVGTVTAETSCDVDVNAKKDPEDEEGDGIQMSRLYGYQRD